MVARASRLDILALAIALALAACGADDALAPPLDALPPPDGPPPALLRVAATDGSYDLAFSVSIDGRGSQRVGTIAIADGAGDVARGARVPALVTSRVAFAEAQMDVYQALVVHPDRLDVVFFYCQAGALTGLFLESTDGTPLRFEPAQGSCLTGTAPSRPVAHLPALELFSPPPERGFTLAGPGLAYDGRGPGTARIGERDVALFPFEAVDCTSGCGTPGWYELHSLLWDEPAGELCSGIFYLFRDRAVALEYVFCLPTLRAAGMQVFAGSTWTTP